MDVVKAPGVIRQYRDVVREHVYEAEIHFGQGPARRRMPEVLHAGPTILVEGNEGERVRFEFGHYSGHFTHVLAMPEAVGRVGTRLHQTGGKEDDRIVFANRAEGLRDLVVRAYGDVHYEERFGVLALPPQGHSYTPGFDRNVGRILAGIRGGNGGNLNFLFGDGATGALVPDRIFLHCNGDRGVIAREAAGDNVVAKIPAAFTDTGSLNFKGISRAEFTTLLKAVLDAHGVDYKDWGRIPGSKNLDTLVEELRKGDWSLTHFAERLCIFGRVMAIKASFNHSGVCWVLREDYVHHRSQQPGEIGTYNYRDTPLIPRHLAEKMRVGENLFDGALRCITEELSLPISSLPGGAKIVHLGTRYEAPGNSGEYPGLGKRAEIFAVHFEMPRYCFRPTYAEVSPDGGRVVLSTWIKDGEEITPGKKLPNHQAELHAIYHRVLRGG
jgi:hypothetical protein